MQVRVDSDDDATFRRRLEGRAERLEVARIRLTALAQMLRALRWKSRLRANTALLRETAADQPAVEEALAVVVRRAKAESWPETSVVVRTAAEVNRLSNRVASLALKRLGEQCRPEDLSQRLEHLELAVLAEPRLVLPGQRWKTAQQVLPPSHPDVLRAGRFAAILESLFKRPVQPTQKRPFSLEELDALAAAWPEGQRALAAVWTRVEKVDSAGTLTALLRRRANNTPMHAPKNGAELVLAAEFWNNFAIGRLAELTQKTVAPVECAEAERFEVLRWLIRRETQLDARLPASDTLLDPRAGLMELAVELSSVPPRPRGGDAQGDAWWKRLEQRAQRAEQAVGAPDYQKLQDNLRLFLRVLQPPNKTPPVYRALATLPHASIPQGKEPATLVALVEAMRAKMK